MIQKKLTQGCCYILATKWCLTISKIFQVLRLTRRENFYPQQYLKICAKKLNWFFLKQVFLTGYLSTHKYLLNDNKIIILLCFCIYKEI